MAPASEKHLRNAFAMCGLQCRPKAHKQLLSAGLPDARAATGFAEECKQHLRRTHAAKMVVEEALIAELLPKFLRSLNGGEDQQDEDIDMHMVEPEDDHDVDHPQAGSGAGIPGVAVPGFPGLAPPQDADGDVKMEDMFGGAFGGAFGAEQEGGAVSSGAAALAEKFGAAGAQAAASSSGAAAANNPPIGRVVKRAPERKWPSHLKPGTFVYDVFHSVALTEWSARNKRWEVSKSRKPELFAAGNHRARAMNDRLDVLTNTLYQPAAILETAKRGLVSSNASSSQQQLHARIQYFPANHDRANKMEILRGQTNLYKTRYALVPKSNHLHAAPPLEGVPPLPPNATFPVTDWHVSAHDTPEIFFKIGYGKISVEKQEPRGNNKILSKNDDASQQTVTVYHNVENHWVGGWVPYRITKRVEEGGEEFEHYTVVPAGNNSKVLITKVQSLVGTKGHKITFGLLVAEDRARRVYALEDGGKRVGGGAFDFGREWGWGRQWCPGDELGSELESVGAVSVGEVEMNDF